VPLPQFQLSLNVASNAHFFFFQVVLYIVGYRGPSASWPPFAQRERKKKSAIPVGMTDKANR
jgi:hypothetical protein